MNREQAHDAWLDRVLPVREVEVFSKRVKGGRGYLMIDDRASGGGLKEFNTLSCAHCNTVVVLNPARTRERGYCSKCHAYICDNPVCHAVCAPIEQRVELAQKYPDLPTLLPDVNGELPFDEEILKQGKPM